MKCRALLPPLLLLGVVSACAAGIGTNRFTLSLRGTRRSDEKFLAVRQGKLSLGPSLFGVVSDNKDAADRWFILNTQIKSSTAKS